MATIYLGTAAEGYENNDLNTVVTNAGDGDTIMIGKGDFMRGENQNVQFSQSLTFKNDQQDHAYDSTTATGWDAGFYTGAWYSPPVGLFRPTGGWTSTQTVIFEGLRMGMYDKNGFYVAGIRMDLCGPYCNVIVNRCYHYTTVARYIYKGVLEIRNCRTIRDYVVQTPQTAAVVNIIKHRHASGSVYASHPATWRPQIQEVVTSLTDGYGPEWGTDIVSLVYPKISGYIKDEGTPVERTVLLIRRISGQVIDSQTSTSEGYYEFDTSRLMTEEYSVIALRDNASPNEQSIIVDRISPVDSRA